MPIIGSEMIIKNQLITILNLLFGMYQMYKLMIVNTFKISIPYLHNKLFSLSF